MGNCPCQIRLGPSQAQHDRWAEEAWAQWKDALAPVVQHDRGVGDMSVIAKMQLNGVLDFGSGSVSKLSCVCENDLMAAYAKADEDKLFTKYSPWGEMKLGHSLRSFADGTKFYVVVLRSKTRPKCEKAAYVHPATVGCVIDYGSSKQVQLKRQATGGYATSAIDEPVVGELDWRMTIDNPPAVAFFEPGAWDYWVAFYPDSKFSQHEALDDAHAE